MTNPKHLRILLEGADAWNSWRFANPDSKPDLSKADLSELTDLNLVGINFSDTDLQDCDLTGIDLSKANLHNANLHNAILNFAILNQCDLRQANLSDTSTHNAQFVNADLENADLVSSDFCDANFSSASLVNANLSDCYLAGVNFSNANLKNVNFTNADLGFVFEPCFTGSNLTGICIDNWKISDNNYFADARCDYFFRKSIFSKQEQKYLFESRYPHNTSTNLSQGEFDKFVYSPKRATWNKKSLFGNINILRISILTVTLISAFYINYTVIKLTKNQPKQELKNELKIIPSESTIWINKCSQNNQYCYILNSTIYDSKYYTLVSKVLDKKNNTSFISREEYSEFSNKFFSSINDTDIQSRLEMAVVPWLEDAYFVSDKGNLLIISFDHHQLPLSVKIIRKKGISTDKYSYEQLLELKKIKPSKLENLLDAKKHDVTPPIQINGRVVNIDLVQSKLSVNIDTGEVY
jgi:uncharacterized protein YjbI with pentapeptide repeats